MSAIGDCVIGECTYICSDTENCYAKTYAEENGYSFRVCTGHTTAHEHSYSAFVTKTAMVLADSNGKASISWISEKLTANKTYSVRVIDSVGKTQTNGSGGELKTEFNVTVKAGFIQKLIAFFKGLFNLTPVIDIKP